MGEAVQDLLGEITSKFRDAIKSSIVDQKSVKVEVGSHQMEAVALFLRDNHGWDHVKAVTAVDLSRVGKKESKLEVIYHLGSYSRDELWGKDLSLSCKLDRPSPKMKTLSGIWPSCEYH
ncbi:MAG: NADH-quinone oxidoreductase subunit C, partial [Nitrososphaerota archaeon]